MVFVASGGLLAKSYYSEYRVFTSGVTIGELFWELDIDEKKYFTEIKLKDRGFLSSLFSFDGHYVSNGHVYEGVFFPIEYSQKWETNKKKRNIQIKFKKSKISKIVQEPKEVEFPRLDMYDLVEYSDPLTSFIKLLFGFSESKTFDGRRVYVMVKKLDDNEKNKKTYIIDAYNNIWADHNRNDLEEITIIKKPGDILPDAVYINFKGRLFKVLKN